MVSFTFPDIVIAVFVGGFLIRGCVRGSFREIFSVVALGIAALLTMQFSDLLRSYAAYFFAEDSLLDSLVKPVLFFGSWLLAVLFFRVMFRVLSIAVLGWISRLGGGLIGSAKGVFFLALGLMIIETHSPGFSSGGDGHRLLPYIRQVSAYIQGIDKVDIQEGLGDVKEKLDEKLDSAKEGVRGMKQKLEGESGKAREQDGESETQEMRR